MFLSFLRSPRITEKQISQRKRADKALDRLDKIEKRSWLSAGRHRVVQQNNHFIQSIFGDPT